jgi:hypothetical protein
LLSSAAAGAGRARELSGCATTKQKEAHVSHLSK